MARSKAPLGILAAATLPTLLGIGPPAQAEERLVEGEIVVIGPVAPIAIDKTLRDLPLAPSWKVGDPLPDLNPRRITNPDALTRPAPVFTPQPDPLVDLQSRAVENIDPIFTAPDVNVAGLDDSCCPPDTVGEVGTTHFIQAVNGSGGAGTRISAPATGSTGPPAAIT